MGKTITLSRWDLVWEGYRSSWNESDFEDFKSRVKSNAEAWKDKNTQALYDAIKDLTWDEVYEDFKNGNTIMVPYYRATYEGEKRIEPSEPTTYLELAGFIRNEMTDEAYNNGVDDYSDVIESETEFDFDEE